MQPTLWGPALWSAFFTSAWACAQRRGAAPHGTALFHLLNDLLPEVLPCHKCRMNFKNHLPRVNRRARGRPSTPEEAFRWLWYLKDEVNRHLGQRSQPLERIRERYDFQGGAVDDVGLGDALVLVAISMHARGLDAEFVDFCEVLAVLLPLPEDSQLRIHMADMRTPVQTYAQRAAAAARIERGLPVHSLTHYKAAASE